MWLFAAPSHFHQLVAIVSILSTFPGERRKRRTNRNTEWVRLRKLADPFLLRTQNSLVKEDGIECYQWTVVRILLLSL